MRDAVFPIFMFIIIFFLTVTIMRGVQTDDTTVKSQWMTVDDHTWGVTSRLKIPGGYLYRDTFRGESVSVCFVPEVAAERS